MHTTCRLVAGCGLILGLVAPASAGQGAAGSGGLASGEVGLTYSVMRSQGQTAPVGLGLDVARTIGRSANDVSIQVVGALGVNRFPASSDADYDYYAATLTSILGGVRFVGRGNGSARPFAQALVGVMHCCGTNSVAVEFGGGVDVPLRRNGVHLRIQVAVPAMYYGAGVDEDGVAYDAGHDTGVRFSIGVAVPIGR